MKNQWLAFVTLLKSLFGGHADNEVVVSCAWPTGAKTVKVSWPSTLVVRNRDNLQPAEAVHGVYTLTRLDDGAYALPGGKLDAPEEFWVKKVQLGYVVVEQ